MTPTCFDEFPWSKERKADASEYGNGLFIFVQSPSRLEVPEDAIKAAKTILRRDAKRVRALIPEMGSASIVEGPICQSPTEWKETHTNWKPFMLPLGWYAVAKKKRTGGAYL